MADEKTIYEEFRLAQQEFPPVIKNKKGGENKFSIYYATLDQCLDAVLKPLHKHGLTFRQITEPSENGAVVETLVSNDRGETLSSGKLFIPSAGMQQKGAQSFGSALTYARRYSLMTFMGLCPEDDDGRAASGNGYQGKQTISVYRPTKGSQDDLFGRAENAATLGYAGFMAFIDNLSEAEKNVIRPKGNDLIAKAKARDKELAAMGENNE